MQLYTHLLNDTKYVLRYIWNRLAQTYNSYHNLNKNKLKYFSNPFFISIYFLITIAVIFAFTVTLTVLITFASDSTFEWSTLTTYKKSWIEKNNQNFKTKELTISTSNTSHFTEFKVIFFDKLLNKTQRTLKLFW